MSHLLCLILSYFVTCNSTQLPTFVHVENGYIATSFTVRRRVLRSEAVTNRRIVLVNKQTGKNIKYNGFERRY